MEQYLFDQLAFVRAQTLKLMEGLTEEKADIVPESFRNNIRWHFGHIYMVLERFAFKYTGIPLEVPAGWAEQFETGTSPLTAVEGNQLPTLQELEQRLATQNERIRLQFDGRLQEAVLTPYTTSAGLHLATVEQFLSFNLYHEAMHLSTIRAYKRLLSL